MRYSRVFFFDQPMNQITIFAVFEYQQTTTIRQLDNDALFKKTM